MKNPKRKAKVVRAWGGFTNDRLHKDGSNDMYYSGVTSIAVYPTRKMARLLYHDVRPVEIREVHKPRGKK